MAVKDYLARISARIPLFETMQEQELNYIKVHSLLNSWGKIANELKDV